MNPLFDFFVLRNFRPIDLAQILFHLVKDLLMQHKSVSHVFNLGQNPRESLICDHCGQVEAIDACLVPEELGVLVLVRRAKLVACEVVYQTADHHLLIKELLVFSV